MTSVSVVISPPQAVGQLTATSRPLGDIELRWRPAEDRVSGTDYYRVYRWLENDKKKKISNDGKVKETSFTDKGDHLKDGVVYYYCVQAVDKLGNEQHEGNQTASCLSDHGVGTPVVSSPTHSSGEWSSNPSPVLTWTAPADATGIAGYYYLLDQSPNTKPSESNGILTEDLKAHLPPCEG